MSKQLSNLIQALNREFKSPLASNVSVEAEITEEGFTLQINDRGVDFDKDFNVIGTCTGPIG